MIKTMPLTNFLRQRPRREGCARPQEAMRHVAREHFPA